MLWLHGLGIATCSSRGAVDWGGEAEDYDAVECLTFCFMPVVPFRCVHVAVESAKEPPETVHHPLRFRASSVFLAFLRRWLWGLLIVGAVGLFASGNRWKRKGAQDNMLVPPAMILCGLMGLWWLDRSDRRRRDVRYLLGRHHLGSSDPVDWKPEANGQTPSPQALYGTETFAEAIPELLRNGEFSRAMWAARLSAAFEDARVGENWTESVLAHPGVRRSLQAVRLNPFRWHAAMVGSE